MKTLVLSKKLFSLNFKPSSAIYIVTNKGTESAFCSVLLIANLSIVKIS